MVYVMVSVTVYLMVPVMAFVTLFDGTCDCMSASL